MLYGDCINPRPFMAIQLYILAISTSGRIAIGGIIDPIAMSVGVKRIPCNRAQVSKLLNLTIFEQMMLCKVEIGRVCWSYLGNQLMPLLNVKRIILQDRANMLFMPDDEDVI